MRRDPREVEDDERPADARAWGMVLGAWAAIFAFLALVVAPILFSLCGVGQ